MGERLVQWDTPISLEENEEILAKLGAFPEVNAYYLTESFLGHQTWVADFLPPHEAEFISQAKRNALKPTIFISGREHANEVSRTEPHPQVGGVARDGLGPPGHARQSERRQCTPSPTPTGPP